MPYVAIIALCMVAAVAYGIVHDQVTARICVEYFTIGHPPVFKTDDPTLLGLCWGVYATWLSGLGLGILLARAARSGNRPPRSLASLVRPVVLLLLVTAVSAVCAGLIGWALASRGWIVLFEPFASEVPQAKHTAFLVDLWAHSASYLVGLIGGGIVCMRVWWSRADRSAA